MSEQSEKKDEMKVEVITDPIQAIRVFVDGIVMVTVRGVIGAMPMVAASTAIIEICRAAGKWSGALFVGKTQIDSFKFRKECKNAFIEGMESAEMISADDRPRDKPKPQDAGAKRETA